MSTFKPVELARKHADKIGLQFGWNRSEDDVLTRRAPTQDEHAEQLLAFARDLIRESGAISALESVSGNSCDSLHHNKGDRHKAFEPCPVEARLLSALSNLYSLTSVSSK